MDDVAWMFRDSASAWLRGYDDGRFAGYESFYRARQAESGSFNLEELNEEYAEWVAERPSRAIVLLNRPIVAQALIALAAVWVAAQALPHLAGAAPNSTAVLLVAAFIALRVFHRKRRKRG
jgi:hypothetical protein